MEDNSSSAVHQLEDIPFEEFDTNSDYVGGGAFGTVKRRFWIKRNILVAMKQLYDEKNFIKEESQLALVKSLIDEDKKKNQNERYYNHIITIFGKTTGKYPNGLRRNQMLQSCIVMEYANSKCLHDLLHKNPDVSYRLEHALSWCLQCAYGVYYLHKHQLIHRDLKPLNLLLFDKGRLLKICDFGTVRQVTKEMTNNRGSSQWMAPEVFSSRHYSDKCDVFSWSIIFWEVLHRDEPFNWLDNGLTISWAISNKTERPPLSDDYPQMFRELLVKTWNQSPDERPTMEDIILWLENIISVLGYANFEQMNRQIETLNMSVDTLEDGLYDAAAFGPNFNLTPAGKQKLGHKRSCSSDTTKLLNLVANTELNMTRTQSDINLVTSDEGDEEEEMICGLMDRFNAYLMLDKAYQPGQPDVNNSKSVSLFEEHRKYSVLLFRQLYEIPLLENKIKDLEQMERNLHSGNSLEREMCANEILEYPRTLYNDNLDLKAFRAGIVQDLLKSFAETNPTRLAQHQRAQPSMASPSQSASAVAATTTTTATQSQEEG